MRFPLLVTTLIGAHLCLLRSPQGNVVSAFILPAAAPPTHSSSSRSSIIVQQKHQLSTSSSSSSLHALNSNTVVAAAVDVSDKLLDVGGMALTMLLQTVIQVSVPALAVFFVLNSLKKGRDGDSSSPRSLMNSEYAEFYEEDDDDEFSPIKLFGRGRKMKKSLKPKEEYLKVERLNDRYDSYLYSLRRATKGQASAILEYQSTVLNNKLMTALPKNAAVDLIKLQQDYDEEAKALNIKLMSSKAKLADLILDEETLPVSWHNETSTVTNATDVNVEKKEEKGGNKKEDKIVSFSFKIGGDSNVKAKKKLADQISKLQEDLLSTELEYKGKILDILEEYEVGTPMEREFKDLLARTPVSDLDFSSKLMNFSKNDDAKKSVYVLDFNGDVTASQVFFLREEVTAILRLINESNEKNAEVVLVIQTGGGTVTGYGLAMAQLQRLKNRGIPLTICVEQVAASGGYLMTAVADKVIASPFAVLGSIGVISESPNFYRRLKDEGIEFQTVTAGKYKRTLTPFKEPNKEDFKKSQKDLEDVLKLFKASVAKNRPKLDIDTVATGETWFGEDALEKGLCDELATKDEVVLRYIEEGADVYEVGYSPPPVPAGLFAGPAGQIKSESGGILRSMVQWVIREVKAEVMPMLQDELRREQFNSAKMLDPKDSYNRVRMERRDDEIYF